MRGSTVIWQVVRRYRRPCENWAASCRDRHSGPRRILQTPRRQACKLRRPRCSSRSRIGVRQDHLSNGGGILRKASFPFRKQRRRREISIAPPHVQCRPRRCERAQGEMDRLKALEGFKQVTAPFDGMVIERNTDIGALIKAGSGVGGGAVVLFTRPDVHRCASSCRYRRESPQICVWADCRSASAAIPDKSFEATVATTARAINQRHALCWSNCMSEIRMACCSPAPIPRFISIAAQSQRFERPDEHAYLSRSWTGSRSDGEDNRIVTTKISIGRDLGNRVEVLTVCAFGSRRYSPPDSLAAGDLIRIAGEALKWKSTGSRHRHRKICADTKTVERAQ